MVSIKKLDNLNILVNGQGYHATWRARTMGDDVVLEERYNGIILREHYGNVQVVDEAGEGRTYDSAIEAMQALNAFIGNFKPAGGAAATTFEPNKSYKTGDTIIYAGAMWTAKADFVAGAAFDEADWDKVSVSVDELENVLNEKLDKTAATDKMYGTDAAGAQTTFNKSDFEMVANKTTGIRDADHATDTNYPTELAVRTNLNSNFDYLNDAKLDKTDDENVIYGTDGDGEQTTYDKDTFGKVDTVNGISPDANKNVQTEYVYATEAEFEADKDNIPVGATVIKLYEYPDNLAGFMVAPDYANEQLLSLTNGQRWTAPETGWLRYKIYVNNDQGDTYIDLLINGSSRIVNGGQNTDKKYFSDMVQVSKGDIVNIRATNSSGLVTTSAYDTYFIPPKFIKKELPVVVEKNGSYSLDEVRTAETWIDGKPIYRKCYTGTFSPSTGTGSATVILETTSILDSFIACGGNVITGHEAQHKRPVPYIGGDFSSANYNFYSVVYNNANKQIGFVHRDASTDTNTGSYTIWIEYTKTTD